jgi:hypothetical protein
VVVHLERRRLGRRQHLELAHGDLDLAGAELRVDRPLPTQDDLALHADAVLAAERLRELV